jgi:hypothetical protein
MEPKTDDPILLRWRILARDYAARPALVDPGSSGWMNCLAVRIHAYISLIDRCHIRTRFSVPALENVFDMTLCGTTIYCFS